jgi:hypothetical protein
MTIHVDMSKWVSMDHDGQWRLHYTKPKIRIVNYTDYGCSIPCGGYWDSGNIMNSIKVTGFTGTWQDSLHLFVDGKWENVK